MKQTSAIVDYLALYSRFVIFAITSWFAMTAQPSIGQTTAGAPWITTQPVSQKVDYGADVAFSVNAGGTDSLTFQWQKDGANLADYENVAGSQTGTLSLVGVAANDMGNYRVIVGYLNGGSVTSSVAALTLKPALVFQDTFENGSSNWSALLNSKGASGANGLAVSMRQNHTAGGAISLMMTNSSQKVYHNLPIQYGCRLEYSFWFFDDRQSQISCGGELRGYTGPGYKKYASPGGLRQIIAIGRLNVPFPTNNTGMLAGKSLDPAKYQARVLHGTNSGWFNLNANRSAGWHQFRIDRSSSASTGGVVDFYVDGTLASTVTDVAMAAVDSIFLGALDTGRTGTGLPDSGSASFDDVAVEVYPRFFDWQSLATDGPIPNWMKLRETGTNWQVTRAVPSTAAALRGSATNGALSGWKRDGDAIVSTGLRGYLDYNVNVRSDGAYRIEVEARERNHHAPLEDMPVEVSIDGELLGRINLIYGEKTNGLLHCFTPYIQAGPHTVRLNWDNVNAYRSLLVQAVRLQALLPASQVNNGMPAWMANRLVSQNGIELCPATSMVSPACLEGRGQYLSMMNLWAGARGQFSSMKIRHGAGHRWYANVPLSVSNATTIVASYQNGGLTETNEIRWRPINLALETNSMTIRKGDSLLLGFSPLPAIEAEVKIAIGPSSRFANSRITTDTQTPIPYQFNRAGTFVVSGAGVHTGTTGSITVTVVDASFEDSPIARVGHARFWNCTNLPPEVVLDPDPRLKLVQVELSQKPPQKPPASPGGPNEREFRVYTRSTEPQYILARLGTNGPVLASTEVRGFNWSVAPETYLRKIDVNRDGSQLVETAFVASPIFPSLSVGVQIISSGVTFDDGTVVKTVSAQDFDAVGTCRLRFVRAAGAKGSTCHTTKLYDNGALIGWR